MSPLLSGSKNKLCLLTTSWLFLAWFIIRPWGRSTCSSETSADFQRTTRRYITEDKTLLFQYLSLFHSNSPHCKSNSTNCNAPTYFYSSTLSYYLTPRSPQYIALRHCHFHFFRTLWLKQWKHGGYTVYHFNNKKKFCILVTGSIYVFRVNSELTSISYLYSINRLSWRQISFVTKYLILKYYMCRFRVAEGWEPWDKRGRLASHQRCGFLLRQQIPIGSEKSIWCSGIILGDSTAWA
jgi:hypothetical protein